MTRIFLLILLFSVTDLPAQKVDWKKIDAAVAEGETRFAKQRKPTPVLLLGVFHFNYPNLDAHKIDSSKMVNVLSEQRQAEMRQLADVIKTFRPTRVYVELQETYQGWLDSLYGKYREGKYKLGRNEIYQLGFRIAGELGHPKLYAVDDNNFVRDNAKRYGFIDSLWINKQPVDSVRDQNWSKLYTDYYTWKDDETVRNTLLESLLLANDPKRLQQSHGHYLSAGFNTMDDRGPDALSMWWYSRNLRIFNNVLKTTPGADDRILVIFGSGHVPILMHLFGASPEFEIVELRAVAEKALRRK